MYKESCRLFKDAKMEEVPSATFLIRTRTSDYFEHLFAVCHLKFQLDDLIMGKASTASDYDSAERAHIYAYHIYTQKTRREAMCPREGVEDSESNWQIDKTKLADYFTQSEIRLYFTLFDEAIAIFERKRMELRLGNSPTTQPCLRIAFANNYVKMKQKIISRNLSEAVLGMPVNDYCTLYAFGESFCSDLPVYDLLDGKVQALNEIIPRVRPPQRTGFDIGHNMAFSTASRNFARLYPIVLNNPMLKYLGSYFNMDGGRAEITPDEHFRMSYVSSLSRACDFIGGFSRIFNFFQSSYRDRMIDQYTPSLTKVTFVLHINAIDNAILETFDNYFYDRIYDTYTTTSTAELVRSAQVYHHLLTDVVNSASKIAYSIYCHEDVKQHIANFGFESYAKFHYYFVREYVALRMETDQGRPILTSDAGALDCVKNALVYTITWMQRFDILNSRAGNDTIFDLDLSLINNITLNQVADNFAATVLRYERSLTNVTPLRRSSNGDISSIYRTLRFSDNERNALSRQAGMSDGQVSALSSGAGISPLEAGSLSLPAGGAEFDVDESAYLFWF
jgi:hypothetical protein